MCRIFADDDVLFPEAADAFCAMPNYVSKYRPGCSTFEINHRSMTGRIIERVKTFCLSYCDTPLCNKPSGVFLDSRLHNLNS